MCYDREKHESYNWFFCPDCCQKTLAENGCIDDGNYDRERFNPKVLSQIICKKCYNKRVEQWELLTQKKGVKY